MQGRILLFGKGGSNLWDKGSTESRMSRGSIQEGRDKGSRESRRSRESRGRRVVVKEKMLNYFLQFRFEKKIKEL